MEKGAVGLVRCPQARLQSCEAQVGELAINLKWFMGNNINDLELMQLANRAFALDPKSPIFRNEPFITQIESFEELLAMLPNHELVVQPSV